MNRLPTHQSRPKNITRATQRLRRMMASYRTFSDAEKCAMSALIIRLGADPKMAITDELVFEHLKSANKNLEGAR